MKNHKVIAIERAHTDAPTAEDDAAAFHAFLDSNESDELVVITITHGDLKAGRKSYSLNAQGYQKRKPFEQFVPGVHGPAEE